MYKLLRRISGSFTGRLDRESEDDVTSSAPQKSRKRRANDDEDNVGTLSKKARRFSWMGSWAEEQGGEPSSPDRQESPVLPQAKETEDVRQVTKGVKEVDLEDKQPTEDAVRPSTDVEVPKENGVTADEAEKNEKTEEDSSEEASEPASPTPELPTSTPDSVETKVAEAPSADIENPATLRDTQIPKASVEEISTKTNKSPNAPIPASTLPDSNSQTTDGTEGDGEMPALSSEVIAEEVEEAVPGTAEAKA